MGKSDEVKFHPIWLRIMYAVNIFITLPLGLAALIAPDTVSSLMGLAVQDPIFAVGANAIGVAVGILAIAGFRSPLKFSPILVFQIIEKVIWLFGFALPNAIAGTLPTAAIGIIGIYVPLTIGNLIAVPWKYILAKSK
jgi:hypothetical protein